PTDHAPVIPDGEMRAEGELLSDPGSGEAGSDSSHEVPDSLACGSASGMTGGKALLLPIAPDHGDGADVLGREAAQIVREAVAGHLLALAGAGLALHLQIDLVDHAHARCPDRVAEALEAAVDLAWHLAVGIVEAVEHVLDGAALGRHVQVLHGHQLG